MKKSLSNAFYINNVRPSKEREISDKEYDRIIKTMKGLIVDHPKIAIMKKAKEMICWTIRVSKGSKPKFMFFGFIAPCGVAKRHALALIDAPGKDGFYVWDGTNFTLIRYEFSAKHMVDMINIYSDEFDDSFDMSKEWVMDDMSLNEVFPPDFSNMPIESFE